MHQLCWALSLGYSWENICNRNLHKRFQWVVCYFYFWGTSTWSVTASFKQAVVTGLCVRAGCDHGVLEQDESIKKCEFGMCCMKKGDTRDRAQVSLNWSLTEYMLLLLNLKSILCWWEVFMQSVYSLDLLKKEETDCHSKVPSLILPARLCLKHKAGWKCGNAFTSFLKYSSVARAVLDFGFGFWRNRDLQLYQASLIRGSIALIFIFIYFILWLASRSVFLKLRVAIPVYTWKHSKSVSKH